MPEAVKPIPHAHRFRSPALRKALAFLTTPPLGGLKALDALTTMELVGYIDALEHTVEELSRHLDDEHTVRRDLAGQFNGMNWDNRKNKNST